MRGISTLKPRFLCVAIAEDVWGAGEILPSNRPTWRELKTVFRLSPGLRPPHPRFRSEPPSFP
jgi:hypothetical protein